MNAADIDLSNWLEIEAPAKVNLMLSVHGRREDGFHALTSLVVALNFGDTLHVRLNGSTVDQIQCDEVMVPVDESNLILKAAIAFRKATGFQGFYDFYLTKRIPIGAGLGGGSSDGVAALKAMDQLAGTSLRREQILELAAGLGSDCPFFVDAVPALMRGRGEILEPLDSELATYLRGQQLVLFRPDFGIGTAWAYGQLAERPEYFYEPEADAMSRIDGFRTSEAIHRLLYNTFEYAVGRKYLAISTLLEILSNRGYQCLMSGSGSCCFALLRGCESAADLAEMVRKCWGDGIFWVETSIS